MRTYIVTKLLHAIAVALVISFVSFFLLFYTADPASTLLPEAADDEDIAEFEAQYGLDRPMLVQYGDFLFRVIFQGDFASSLLVYAVWSLVVFIVGYTFFTLSRRRFADEV